MSKIAGIKGHSPEAYPDTPFSGGIATASHVNNPAVVLSAGTTTSLLGVPPSGPGPIQVEADDGERIIVLFSGFLQDPNSGEGPNNETANLFVYLGVNGGTPSQVYEISVLVSIAGSPLPVNIYLGIEAASSALYTVDVRGQTGAGTVQAVANSLVVAVSPR